jgi:hypothetical protein
MLDFRKVLLGLAVAGLGLVGTASAQTTCTVVATASGFIALEGTTEALPAFSMGCTGVSGGSVTFVLTTNGAFTNRTLPAPATNLDVILADTTAADIVGATIAATGSNGITITLPAGISAASTITISNLRENSSAVAGPSATVSVIGASNVIVPTTNNPQPLGFISKALGAVTVLASGVGPQTLCSLLPTAVFPQATVTVNSLFPDSLKMPSEVQNGSGAQTVLATQGTRVAVTLSNLNAGVNYYVPATLNLAGGTATGTLVLSAFPSASGTTAATPVAAGGVGAGQILVTSASPTVYYGVTASNGFTLPTSFNFVVSGAVPVATAVTPSASAIGASVALVGPASPAYPGESGAVTYTATQTATAANLTAGAGTVSPCVTTLLFPYITNTGGFDTGIAISNASTGITGTAITPTSGSCSVTFYGTGAPTAAYSTGTLATATDAVLLVSGQAPGLSGYAVAVCNFQGAHGYAFITDGFGGGGRGLSADYLAIVEASGGAATANVSF